MVRAISKPKKSNEAVMIWRKRSSLTPDEARQLHYEALVIDTLAYVNGFQILSTPTIEARLRELIRQGADRFTMISQLTEQSKRELTENEEAREAYMEVWQKSGVTTVLYTMSDGGNAARDTYEGVLKMISNTFALLHLFRNKFALVLDAGDIERAYKEKKRAIVLILQNATAFEDRLERIEFFYNLGIRSVQLAYQARNLLGDGCGEREPAGLSRFGVEVVRIMNELGMVVDVSHCSEKIVLDAVKFSKVPISANHTGSYAVYPHIRNKSDEALKAIANKGGYIGVCLVPPFLHGQSPVTLDHFADHMVHIARVAGLEALGIGTDRGTVWNIPAEAPSEEKIGGYSWLYFPPGALRPAQWAPEGFKHFGDWPELTVTLAKRGFNEEELRKILGLNYLRFFKEVVG